MTYMRGSKGIHQSTTNTGDNEWFEVTLGRLANTLSIITWKQLSACKCTNTAFDFMQKINKDTLSTCQSVKDSLIH